MKVSVIIPVYNVSAYIKCCIKSVMSQTYHNMECIIVDDATQDDSITQCEQMIAAYHGPILFSILHHDRNRGLSAARNTGMDAATGDYIYYLDSDDEITNDCIEKLVRPVEQDATIEMVVGNYVGCSNGKQIPRRQTEKNVASCESVRDFYFCQRGFYVNAWNKLVKRELLARHHIRFKEGLLFEDNLWTFFLLKHLCHVYIISDVTYLYYRRPHSIMVGTDRGKKHHHWSMLYDEIAHHFTPAESGKEARYYIRYICFMIVRNQTSQGLYPIAQPYLKALYNDHYVSDFIFYYIIVSLSRFGMGRMFLRYAIKIVQT